MSYLRKFWRKKSALSVTHFFLNTCTHTRTPLPSVFSRSSLRVIALVFSEKNIFLNFLSSIIHRGEHNVLFVVLLKRIPTRTHTHTHKTKFLKIILPIEFCRLNRAVTWSVRDSTPGQGNPWPTFWKISKIALAIQPAHQEVPSTTRRAQKTGFKISVLP